MEQECLNVLLNIQTLILELAKGAQMIKVGLYYSVVWCFTQPKIVLAITLLTHLAYCHQ